MRRPTFCLTALLLLAACEVDSEAPDAESAIATTEPDAEPIAPAEPEVAIEGADDLLGTWVITEQAGAAPADVYFATFTREGAYVIRHEGGSTERARFRIAGDHLLAVTDSSGTREFVYEVDGRTLVLSVPGTENRTILERRDANY